MKCPNCNGVPYDEVWTCDVCDGKGIVEPLTEQEYLQTCTTEQLATFLAIVQYDGTDLTLKKNHVEKWVEWLKQPHSAK